MRCLLIVILLYCLFNLALCRPADDQENESELDVDYERGDANAAEEGRSDEEAPLNDQSSKSGDQEVVQLRRFNRNEYQNARSPTEEREARRSTYNNFPEYKLDKKIESRDDEPDVKNDDLSNYKHRQSDRYRYLGNNPDDQLVPNPDNLSSGLEGNEMQNDASHNRGYSKRKSDVQPEDSGDLLFENTDYKRDQAKKVKHNDRSDDSAESAEQPQFYQKYYNSIKNEAKQFENIHNYENSQDETNRERRAIPDFRSKGTSLLEGKENEKTYISKVENEDDQAAIKRHIKKLSNNELNDLLNSLSEDKRALLQTIIDSDATNNEANIVKKREITKKAGAVEENSYLDGGQDSNKAPGPSINMNTADLPSSPNTDNTEASKSTANPSDNADIAGSTKNAESNSISFCSKKDPISANEESATDKLGSNINLIAPTAESVTSKTENKREIDLNAFNNDDSFESDLNANESLDPSNEQSYVVCSQDEDLSQLMDDEAQLHYENRNTQKRDTSQESNSDFIDSIKSLQESFPNSNAYDDSGPYTGSDMALIRVKRRMKNHAVKKRAAAIFPQSKVAYVPYRAENEDEDNDEGSEFYDDGFFDRTASLAKSKVNKISASRRKILQPNTKSNSNDAKKLNFVGNANSDTMNIGSDTDSVLSGVEGVNENLMYNGGARKKRAAERDSELKQADDLLNDDLLTCPPRSTTAASDDTNKFESFSDVINYAGNEAFGPLPRHYDGELSRYKRIRRLKQPVGTKELLSTNATVE